MRLPWQKKPPTAAASLDGIVEQVTGYLGIAKDDPEYPRKRRAVNDDLTAFLAARFQGRAPSAAEATRAITEFRDRAKSKYV